LETRHQLVGIGQSGLDIGGHTSFFEVGQCKRRALF
jgi:hypothetical protein